MCYRDRYYASQIDLEKGSNTIYIYRYNKSWLFKKWKKVHSFNVSASAATLNVCDEMITCCAAIGSMIAVYSLNGNFIRVYGSRGFGEAGEFTATFTHYGDDAGSVLISDTENNRLQAMTENGKFSVLKLEPAVVLPCSAMLYRNYLYVSCDSNHTGDRQHTLFKYRPSNNEH